MYVVRNVLENEEGQVRDKEITYFQKTNICRIFRSPQNYSQYGNIV